MQFVYLGKEFHCISEFPHHLSHPQYNRFPRALGQGYCIHDAGCDGNLHKTVDNSPNFQKLPSLHQLCYENYNHTLKMCPQYTKIHTLNPIHLVILRHLVTWACICIAYLSFHVSWPVDRTILSTEFWDRIVTFTIPFVRRASTCDRAFLPITELSPAAMYWKW